MSVFFEGYQGIDCANLDNFPKEIIEIFTKQIENKFNYENLYVSEESKNIDIHFDSQIEFEECFEWLDSQMKEDSKDNEIRNFLINSHIDGNWRVVGESNAGKIVKNSKENNIKKYDLDFLSIPEAVLLVTNNLNFSKSGSWEAKNDARIELIDSFKGKEKTTLLIKLIGVFQCILLFQKKYDEDFYECVFERASESLESDFPNSVSEVLQNFDLNYNSCEGDVSVDYYYELIYNILSEDDKAYTLIELEKNIDSNPKINLYSELELDIATPRNFSAEGNELLINIKTLHHLIGYLNFLGYYDISTSYQSYEDWFGDKCILRFENFSSNFGVSNCLRHESMIMIITPTKLLSKTFEDFDGNKVNRISICVELDSDINSKLNNRKILNWFFFDRQTLNLYELNPETFSIQKLDEAIDKTVIFDKKPIKMVNFELNCLVRDLFNY